MNSRLLCPAVCAAVLTFSMAASADDIHLKVTQAGTPIGENSYSETPDGAFKSSTTLGIGAITISSTVSGHFSGGKLTDYIGETNGPTGKGTIQLKEGKIHAVVGGKGKDLPFENPSGLYAGNLLPQFTASALLAAEKQILANPADKETSVKAYFLDLGAVLPLKIRLVESKPVQVHGVRRLVRKFITNITGVEAEYDLDEQNHVVAMDVPSQKIRILADGWDVLFVDPIAKFPELSQATFKTVTEKGVRTKMRDGVELVCDVVRPSDSARHPVILSRTPYGRATETINGAFYASRGYVYVAQDCRGREDSQGNWDPFINEGPDGFDTIEWAAKQPWSNGKVGMIGGSYGGYVQWAAAVLNPPALKCIVPEVSPPDAMHNIPYDGGTFPLFADLWWSKIVAGRKTDFSSLRSALPNVPGLTTLPLKDIDQSVLGQKLDFFQRWLDRTTIQDWKGFDYTYHLSESHVPALHISGIWDGDEIGTQTNWNALRQLGRKDQWIVFGPWVHAFNTTHSLGDQEYGESAIIDLESLNVRWFDTWLKGKRVGFDKIPHVKLFVTGANKWVSLPDWPSAGMKKEELFFTRTRLSKSIGAPESLAYTYDPAKDTKIPEAAVSMDQQKVSTVIKPGDLNRGGHVVLLSDPFTKSTAIASPVTVRIDFECSAEDTDFYEDLLDVSPDGKMQIFGQPGKVRASYLKGMDKQRPLVRGRAYTAILKPWDFAHEFKPGHRLGILITSTMFPAYARNLGTVDPIKTATRMVPQTNTILMGRGHPSSVSYEVLWER